MKVVTITRADAQDRRFSLHRGAGSDAVHTNGEYAFAVTQLHTDCGLTGYGITLTMGKGNRVVCDIIEQLTGTLVGREIEELMAEFGAVSKRLANDPALRWLGPRSQSSTLWKHSWVYCRVEFCGYTSCRSHQD